MGRTFSGVLGPLAFVTVLARSLVDGGGAEATLVTATICLFSFAGVGYVVGQIADSIVWSVVRARFDEELQARQAATGKGSDA